VTDQTYQRGHYAPQKNYRSSTALYLLLPGCWNKSSIQSPAAFTKHNFSKTLPIFDFIIITYQFVVSGSSAFLLQNCYRVRMLSRPREQIIWLQKLPLAGPESLTPMRVREYYRLVKGVICFESYKWGSHAAQKRKFLSRNRNSYARR